MPINPYEEKLKGIDKRVFCQFPFHEFGSGPEMEDELALNEVCFASVPNPSPKGFEKCVALVYKNEDGEVFSFPMNQHNGILKDTPENAELLYPKNETTAVEPETEQNVVKFRGKPSDKSA